eukprot:6058814-Ditylum_brightwellii.AAC.1
METSATSYTKETEVSFWNPEWLYVQKEGECKLGEKCPLLHDDNEDEADSKNDSPRMTASIGRQRVNVVKKIKVAHTITTKM